jgi:kinesin family protein 5
VTDATKVPVKNIGEVGKLIKNGSRERATAETMSNKDSSRSHALLVLTIQKNNRREGKNKFSQLYMVDLCGSEKIAKTGATHDRLTEGQYINKSLLSLGNVIAALSERRGYIPYRDSKLTRLLQNCFGGNAYTSLILCCSSNSYNSTESLSTLRFGDRANLVHNKPVVN